MTYVFLLDAWLIHEMEEDTEGTGTPLHFMHRTILAILTLLHEFSEAPDPALGALRWWAHLVSRGAIVMLRPNAFHGPNPSFKIAGSMRRYGYLDTTPHDLLDQFKSLTLVRCGLRSGPELLDPTRITVANVLGYLPTRPPTPDAPA